MQNVTPNPNMTEFRFGPNFHLKINDKPSFRWFDCKNRSFSKKSLICGRICITSSRIEGATSNSDETMEYDAHS